MELEEKFVSTILEKHAEPLFTKIAGKITEEWNKFKIDSDLAFRQYLSHSYEKYSKIKTVLYRTEPKYIYDFFEYPTLKKDAVEISSKDVDNILDVSKYTIISGTGGVGKSTLMKHLFLNELSKKDLIPIFVELKNLNNIPADYDIKKFVFEQLDRFGVSIDYSYMEYALKSGCFLILLDGYDEIITSKRDVFYNKITTFIDKYSENYFVLSSRPYSDFIEFQNFTVLNLMDFTKDQALSLVKKLDYDSTIKQHFLIELDQNLYEQHQSFASNPLLLTIMLMTYDNYAEIPEKLHVFYANAFETLYSKHDATKGGYKRELKSELTFDEFRRVFACFCFITYSDGSIEFSHEELTDNLLKVAQIMNIPFVSENLIDDLSNSICVLCREGLNYRFTHRSFQEYFTAIFLKELSDAQMQKVAMNLIDFDEMRTANDAVFDMLYDMNEDRFEQNILLPILKKVEYDCATTDKYNFYYTKFPFEFSIRDDFCKHEGEFILVYTIPMQTKFNHFLHKIARIMIIKDERKGISRKKEDSLLIQHVLNLYGNEKVDKLRFYSGEFKEDSIEYRMLKKSWIGIEISVLAELKDKIIQKKEKMDLNLTGLFS